MAMCLILCTSQVSVLPKRQDRLSCFLAHKLPLDCVAFCCKKILVPPKTRLLTPAIVFKTPEHCPKLWIIKILPRHINRRKVLLT